jgi:hypothetical protein
MVSGFNGGNQIGTGKRACVYEYLVNSRVADDTEAIVSCPRG